MSEKTTSVGLAVVTGAAGHLGNNLVRLLLDRGRRVRALVVKGENLASLEGLDVEIVEGDVRDPGTLDRAFEGADIVFHMASVVSLMPGRSELLEQVNVRGARNVAESCLRTGVRRLVHTSTIHALPEPPPGVGIDESAGCDPSRTTTEYSRSKARGTLEVLEVVGKGLDAVIVFPSGVIGPNDFGPSPAGRMILDFMNGRLPVSVEGGFNFVDVRDVGLGHILAAEKGATGEGYILSGEWISMTDVLREVSRLVGRPAPAFTVPGGMAEGTARILTWFGTRTGRRPFFSTDMVEALLSNSRVASTKAKAELGFSPRPIRESIRHTVDWFKNAWMAKT